MATVIDFHTHILPGVDDGSASLEESIAMLRMEAEQGIRAVITTPHFYPQHDNPERFIRRRREAARALLEEMKKYKGLPKFALGAEVYYFNGISDSDAISQLTIGSGRCILIEMPHAPWTDAMYRELEGLHVKRGLTPIIAHVDRYISPFHTFRIPQRLAELPVLVQANAEFFLNRATASMALRMLKHGDIHLLGTDCHNTRSRKPNMDAALRVIEGNLGDRALSWIHSNERSVFSKD